MAPALPRRRATVRAWAQPFSSSELFIGGGPEMAPALPRRRATVSGPFQAQDEHPWARVLGEPARLRPGSRARAGGRPIRPALRAARPALLPGRGAARARGGL